MVAIGQIAAGVAFRARMHLLGDGYQVLGKLASNSTLIKAWDWLSFAAQNAMYSLAGGGGEIDAVIVIPFGVEESIGKGEPVDITVYYDPSQTTSAQVILPVLQQVIDAINIQMTGQPVVFELVEESCPR